MPSEQLKNPEACPVQEHARFQDVTWRIERLGWLVMAVIVTGALFGLFGGPGAETVAQAPTGNIRVTYAHFLRQLAPTEIRIAVDTGANPVIDLVVDQALADAFEMRTISPEPLETLAHDGGVLMRFAVSSENKAPAQLLLLGVPGKFGRIRGHIGLLDAAPVPLRMFVFP